MKRVKLNFAGLEVEFCDRERALQQVRAVSYTHLTLPTILRV